MKPTLKPPRVVFLNLRCSSKLCVEQQQQKTNKQTKIKKQNQTKPVASFLKDSNSVNWRLGLSICFKEEM